MAETIRGWTMANLTREWRERRKAELRAEGYDLAEYLDMWARTEGDTIGDRVCLFEMMAEEIRTLRAKVAPLAEMLEEADARTVRLEEALAKVPHICRVASDDFMAAREGAPITPQGMAYYIEKMVVALIEYATASAPTPQEERAEGGGEHG